jgi:lipopolysaccharide transport system permease protein
MIAPQEPDIAARLIASPRVGAVVVRECRAMAQLDQLAQTTVIRPRRGWVGIGARELYAHRELLYFLVWRDLKVRYKQTAIGALWAFLQPLLLMGILTLFLGRMVGIRPDVVPYHIFVLAGLVPWMLFSQSLAGAGNSLVDGSALLTKVYFPRLLFPIAAAGSKIVDFAIALGLLAVIAIFAGFVPQATWLFILPLGMLALSAALAAGLWLAALNVRYRDFRHAIPFLIQVWFFATPIAYGAEAIPESARSFLALNPMTGVVDGFRWAITGGATPVPDFTILVSTAATAIMLAGGLAYFRRVERDFADIV